MKKNKLYYIISDLLILAICFSVFVFAFKGNDELFVSSEGKAIYNGNKNKNNVSIMINVYWGTEYLDDIMQIFLNNNVKATFFIGGSWASQHTEMLRKININGFEIGSHGYSHLDHDKIDYDTNYEELKVTHKLVKAFTGIDMNLFAPPSGAYNKTTLEVASKLNYKTIMWSKDTIDWRDQDSDLIFSRATKNLQNGDLILMHPTKCTLEALPKIVEYILGKGFNLVDVSTNIA